MIPLTVLTIIYGEVVVRFLQFTQILHDIMTYLFCGRLYLQTTFRVHSFSANTYQSICIYTMYQSKYTNIMYVLHKVEEFNVYTYTYTYTYMYICINIYIIYIYISIYIYIWLMSGISSSIWIVLSRIVQQTSCAGFLVPLLYI